ncbi:MAG: hypothetical protein KC656_30245 [Myxococcales bacterium]|nr:hypothetical protein [Myxococcales bacterium]
MRRAVLFLGLASGCTGEGVGFSLLSALPGEVEGVALEGQRARVGMAGQVCDVDVLSGEVVRDTQPTSAIEHVLATLDGRVLGTVPDGLFLQDADQVALWPWPALDGALAPEGPVALLEAPSGACIVAFGADARELHELDCTGRPGFGYDPDARAAWIADGTTLARIGRDGAASAWDAPVDTVVATGSGAVVGARGTSRLDAVSADGERLWSGFLRGQTLEQLAPFAGGVVAMAGDDRGGALAVFGPDGERRGTHPLPGTGTVAVDDAGTTLAITTPDATLFYRVEGDGIWDVQDGLHAPGGPSAGGVALGVATGLTVSGVALAAATVLVSE